MIGGTLAAARATARAALCAALCVAAVAASCLAGCKREDAPRPPALVASTASAAASPAPAPPAANGVRVVFFGDSLTAGLGLDVEQAFPALVGRALASEGLPVRVVNAGVSGDTTADGLGRLDWILKQKPDVLVLELGANDGLRGLAVDEAEKNLRQIIVRSRAAGADVLLLGMRMPPSQGPEYAERFRAMYPTLARELSVPLVPFLLEGVGGNPALNQADGIHPTAEGQQKLATNVLAELRPIVRARAAKAGAPAH